MNDLEATVAKDEKLIESLTRLEPVFLLEYAQDLAASARYLKSLREAKAELRPADAEYVASHISRALTRAMQHLDEAGFNHAYDAYHDHLIEVVAERSEKVIAEHDCGILEGLMTEKDKTEVAEAMRERTWSWFWKGMGRLKAPARSFARVAEFARNTRNHWLLRPVAIGGSIIAVDAANMAGEVIGLCQAVFDLGDLLHRLPSRPDVVIKLTASLPSIPMGLSAIVQPFLCKRGEKNNSR
jgi:hypothetical protein